MPIIPYHCTHSSRLRFHYFRPVRWIIIFIYFFRFPSGRFIHDENRPRVPGTNDISNPSVRPSGPIIGRDHGKSPRTGTRTHGVVRILRIFVNETRRTIVRTPRLIKPGTIQILIHPITSAVISIMRRIRRAADVQPTVDCCTRALVPDTALERVPYMRTTLLYSVRVM